MNAIKAVLLGVIQGLTEFLPVSSSGHLVLGQHLFGLKEPELLFDIFLHIATLAAIAIVFRRELISLTWEFVRLPVYLRRPSELASSWRTRNEFRMLVLIVVGSMPTGLIGVLFKDWFESLFASPMAVGAALLVTGAALYGTKRSRPAGRGIGRFSIRDALGIGLAQGLAITPGISRSGFTISAGLFLGLDRDLAARYSFLLFIPAALGALALQIKDSEIGAFGPVEITAGAAAAFVTGLAALIFLLNLVRRGRLHYFAYYCWAVGLITIAASAWSN